MILYFEIQVVFYFFRFKFYFSRGKIVLDNHIFPQGHLLIFNIEIQKAFWNHYST